MTTSGGRRDVTELRAGFEAWCAQHRPDVIEAGIEELVHPKAGLSNETIIVRCRPGDRGEPGLHLVLRLPPLTPSFPDQDFGLQARVQDAVSAAGIPTAAPITVEDDPRWLGVPFIVMPFVDGQIPGPASLFDPWMTEATETQRRDAQREMIRMLAAIHSIDWADIGLTELLSAGDGRLEGHLDWWTDYLRWASDGEALPRIEALLAWCRDHRPPGDVPLSLVWGDPRLENLIFDEHRRPIAVLDWELATIGPAEMDLGWFVGLERVLWELTSMDALPGSATPDELATDLGDLLGRRLQDPAWHEIFAVTRSICINVRQAKISAAAGVSYLLPPGEANPLVTIVEGWIAKYTAPPT